MMTQEQLGYMKTEDLIFYVTQLEDDRYKQLNRNYNVTDIEIEIAWVQRELECRRITSDLHQKYLQANPDENESW